jgi:hypothetical protein
VTTNYDRHPTKIAVLKCKSGEEDSKSSSPQLLLSENHNIVIAHTTTNVIGMTTVIVRYSYITA